MPLHWAKPLKRFSLMCNHRRVQVPSSAKHVVNISRFSSRRQTKVAAYKSRYHSGRVATRKILRRRKSGYCGFFKWIVELLKSTMTPKTLIIIGKVLTCALKCHFTCPDTKEKSERGKHLIFLSNNKKHWTASSVHGTQSDFQYGIKSSTLLALHLPQP